MQMLQYNHGPAEAWTVAKNKIGPCIFQRYCPDEVEIVHAPRGRTIIMQDQNVVYVYHLHDGIAAGIMTLKDGHELTSLFLPPIFIGLGGFVDMYKNTSRVHLVETRAVTPVTYCRVRREVAWQLLDDRHARSEIFNLVYENYLTAIILTGSNVKHDVSNRILHIIQAVARAQLNNAPNGATLIPDLSQEELSFLSNTTRTSTTRVLTKLKQRGLIEISRRRIAVPNLSRLLALTSITDI